MPKTICLRPCLRQLAALAVGADVVEDDAQQRLRDLRSWREDTDSCATLDLCVRRESRLASASAELIAPAASRRQIVPKSAVLRSTVSVDTADRCRSSR